MTKTKAKPQWQILFLAIMTIGVLLFSFNYSQYQQLLRLEKEILLSQAKVVDENLKWQLHAIYQSLLNTILNFNQLPDHQKNIPALNSHLKSLELAMPSIRTFIILNDQGDVLSSNRKELIKKNFKDREYFKVAKNEKNSSQLLITPPFTTSLGVYSMNVSVASFDPRGKFIRSITATLNPNYFKMLLESTTYSPQVSSAIIHENGQLFIANSNLKTTNLVDFKTFHQDHPNHKINYSFENNMMIATFRVTPTNLQIDKPLLAMISYNLNPELLTWKKNTLFEFIIYFALSFISILFFYLFRQRQLKFQAISNLYRARQKENTIRTQIATEAAGVGIWEFNLLDRQITGDQLMYKIFDINFNYKSWQLNDWISTVDKADQKIILAQYKKLLLTKKPFKFEFNILHADGSSRKIRTIGRLLNDPINLEALKIIGTCEDITKENEQLEIIKQSDRLMKNLVNIIPGMLGYWDKDMHCKFANEKYLLWLEKNPTEIKDINIQSVLSGQTERFERVITNLEGPTHYYWTHYIPDFDGPLIQGFFVLIVDISELKKAQLIAEKTIQAKSEFLSNISHEMKTPLTSIIGLIHLISLTDLAPPVRIKFEHIQIAAQNLQLLINDLLDLSKIEAKKMVIEKKQFKINTVINNVLTILNPIALNKEIIFTSHLSKEIPELLMGDAARLEQILINLGGNAIKFTPQGNVTLISTVEKKSNQQIFIKFSIIDTGIGIDPAMLGPIFESFTQAENSTERQFGGSGLGLTICQKLVEMMGGKIEVKSKKNQGSEFYFTLPFEMNRPKGPRLLNKKILVVDDNFINREFVREILLTEGALVEVAESGLEAIEKIRQDKNFNLILMDIQMPKMDGYEASKKIKEIQNIPIFAMTANSYSDQEQMYHQSHLNEYISKPIKIEELILLIIKNI